MPVDPHSGSKVWKAPDRDRQARGESRPGSRARRLSTDGSFPQSPQPSVQLVGWRVLDKGIVIAGDIRVKLVDIDLLSIQIRLVICSVDKAKEMGMDWWVNNPIFRPNKQPEIAASLTSLEQRLATLEASLSKAVADAS
jgi:hypothetical protein